MALHELAVKDAAKDTPWEHLRLLRDVDKEDSSTCSAYAYGIAVEVRTFP